MARDYLKLLMRYIRSDLNTTIVHYSIEIAIRSGNDAHVHFDFPHTTNAEERARFDRAQELRLQLRRQFRHFVEKQRPAVGEFERPSFLPLAPENAPAS